MKKVIYAPTKIVNINLDKNIKIFLAGTIDNGKSDDWQQHFIDQFSDEDDITFWNPRRPDWDPTWNKSADDPKFREQVLWELRGLSYADIVVMYFMPQSLSPVSMLELGLMSDKFKNSGRLIVCCPTGFWRKGNVDIVCELNKIQTAPTLVHAIQLVKETLAFEKS